jgi:1,4-alpha-glucan branching enzyme
MIKKTYVKSRKVWKVTFELPVEECPQDIYNNIVNLVGDFNNWSHDANPMVLHNDVYKTTLELKPDHDYQFRYLVNDSTWCNDWHADAYIPNGFGEENCVARLPRPDEQK